MVLTWTKIKYPIMIKSILGIWASNCLIPPKDTKLMGGQRHMGERDDCLCLRASPEDDIILTHYMISAWWSHLMGVLGHYVICLGVVKQIFLMTNNIMILGYTYDKSRLNNPPNVFCQIACIIRLISYIPSRLSWDMTLRGGDQYLLRPIFPKSFYITITKRDRPLLTHL